MNITEKYQTLAFGDNGYPEDAFLRRVVYLVWHQTSQNKHDQQGGTRKTWENTFASMIVRHLPTRDAGHAVYSWRMAVGKRLVDGLEKAGTFVADGSEDNLRFAGNRLAPDTVEAKTANYAGALKKLAEKTVNSPEAQVKLLNFLTDARGLYGFHFTETSEGRAVMFPSRFIFDEAGFRLDAATAFVSTERGLEVWDIPGSDRFKLRFEAGRPKYIVSLEGLTCSDAKTYDYLGVPLLPHAGKSSFSKTVNQVSRDMIASVKCLAGKRELLSIIVGEDIEPGKWLGFVQSFYKARSFFTSIRGVVFSILDADARKCAGRAQKATYEDYNWFFSGSPEFRERKIQASNAFPLFTGEFRAEPFNSAISHGEPLLPLIADKFGLSIPQVRQTRGLHWQRLGKAIHQYKEIFKEDNRLFMGVPPEKMPRTKKDWSKMGQLAKLYRGSTVSALSDNMIIRLNRSLLDDFDKIPEAQGLDMDSVTGDIARTLAPFVTGEYNPYQVATPQDRAAFFGAILGGNFGVKRLRSLSEDWHRLAPLRTGAIRLMLRKVHNIPLAVWEPLTENFECEHGTLTWLTNEAELISEGLRMRHCVGSYIDRCVLGETNIATILSVEGDLSTVEVRLGRDDAERGKQYVVQHRAYKNGNPADLCEQVLASYLKKYRKKKLTAKGGTPSERPPDISIPMDDTMRDSLIEAYKDCVPAKVFAMTSSDWEQAYRTYTRDGSNFGRVDDDFEPYDAF